MRTKILLLRITIYFLLLVLFGSALILCFIIPGLNTMVLKSITLIVASASWFSLLFTAVKFHREKHLIILNHKIGAMKKIWNKQRWVLLSANAKDSKDLEINFHFSNEIDLQSALNIVLLTAKNAETANAAVATQDILRQSGIDPNKN